MAEHYRWLAPRRRLEDTVALACREPGHAVLEVGCGDGILLGMIASQLARMGNAPARVTGVDLARGRLSRARTRVAGGFVCASAESLPLSAAAFDLVICAEVLEHLPEPARALSELRRVARPGARLVLSIPVVGWSRWIEARLLGRVRFLDEEEHLREYCKQPLARCETIAALLERVTSTGFEVMHERGIYCLPHRGERVWNATLGAGPLAPPARALDRWLGHGPLRYWGRWLLIEARAR